MHLGARCRGRHLLVPDLHPFYFALATKRIGQPIQAVADDAVNAFDTRREGFRKLISDRVRHMWLLALALGATFNLWRHPADRELRFRNFGESTFGSGFGAGAALVIVVSDKRSSDPTRRHPSRSRELRENGSGDLPGETPTSTQRPPIAASVGTKVVVALDRAPTLGFEIFVLSAPTPFVPSEAEALKRAAADVIENHFPDAPALYARRGWRLPTSIGRVYDTSRIQRVLGFRCATNFGCVLEALRTDDRLPFTHQPA